MKLRLSELENVRKSPTMYRDGAARSQVGYRFSKFRALKFAAYKYHESNGNLPLALDHLRNLYTRNFKRADTLDDLEAQLEDYAASYTAQGNVAIEWNARAIVEYGDLQLTGEVPRIDLALSSESDYAIWLLEKSPWSWGDELRMPILQRHYAMQMGVPCLAVSVGSYYFDERRYEYRIYSDSDVAQAHLEMTNLAREVLGTA